MADLDPLILLKDIHLGPPISAWPPSFFLVGCAVSIMLVVVGGIGLWVWRQKRLRAQHSALLMLKEIQRLYTAPTHHHRLVQEINIVLKRYIKSKSLDAPAMTAFGEPWLEFLESKAPGLVFKTGVGQVLASGGYDPHVQVDVQALLNHVELWLKRSQL